MNAHEITLKLADLEEIKRQLGDPASASYRRTLVQKALEAPPKPLTLDGTSSETIIWRSVVTEEGRRWRSEQPLHIIL